MNHQRIGGNCKTCRQDEDGGEGVAEPGYCTNAFMNAQLFWAKEFS